MSDAPYHFAFFIYGLTGGGAQRRTLTLVNAIADLGYHVDLVVVAREPRRGRLSSLVHLVPLDNGWRRALTLLNRSLNVRGVQTALSIPALSRYLRSQRPDVLLSTANHVNHVAVWARRLARVPIPLVLRVSNYLSGNLCYGRLFKNLTLQVLHWIDSYTYSWADALIAVSNGVADNLVQLTGIPREHIVTIYNPVVTPELQTQAQEPPNHPWFDPVSQPVVLGVGTLKLQKDFPTLIRAFARVRAVRPARLVLLGEGPERGRLEHLIRRLGLTADVDLPGYVDNPYAWMARASVFVLSSVWEGLPGVLIEAMACGCPVVSTDCPSGAAEILDQGLYGPLVPVGDDRGLADAILSVLEHPKDKDLLRARAEVFAVQPAVSRYLDVLLGQISPSSRHLTVTGQKNPAS